MTSAVWGKRNGAIPYERSASAGLRRLVPSNETAVETWTGQSPFHGSTFDVGAADDLFDIIRAPMVSTLRAKDLDPSPAGRISCLFVIA
ncbi:uncharacterized protein N7473_008768 [Penicillium subrubescens]|nr:uncharacterized protein N7473_008768 [Penicillium subrubescens]KAJ5886094.1 hypothetical protein N7473_008768 [Penicillium subrubescens]